MRVDNNFGTFENEIRDNSVERVVNIANSKFASFGFLFLWKTETNAI